MYLKQRFFLFAIPFLLLSCEETNTTTFSKLPSFNLNQDSSTIQQESHVEKIYFNVPSTMKTAYILKKAGATYDASFPLNPNKANDDFTTEQQALLLGIYGSDLNYTIVSNKNQETIYYLNSINSLGEKLGLGNILNQEMKNRIEKNVNSKDSMQVIITDLFWKIEQSLNEDGRSRIGALIVTGGWIEGLYVATQIAIKMPENIKIKSIICQQKFSSKRRHHSLIFVNFVVTFLTMDTFLFLQNIGGPGLILILLIVLLLFGGKKIPELMKGLGKGMKEFKDASNDKNEDSEPTDLKKD